MSTIYLDFETVPVDRPDRRAARVGHPLTFTGPQGPFRQGEHR